MTDFNREDFREQAGSILAVLQVQLEDPSLEATKQGLLKDAIANLSELYQAEGEVSQKERRALAQIKRVLKMKGLQASSDDKAEVNNRIREWLNEHCLFYVNQDDVPCFDITYPKECGHVFTETRLLITLPTFILWVVPTFLGEAHPIPKKEERQELLLRFWQTAKNARPKETCLRTGLHEPTNSGYLFRGKYGTWEGSKFNMFSDWVAYRVPAAGRIEKVTDPGALPLNFIVHDDVKPLELEADLDPSVDFEKHYSALVNGDEDAIRGFALSIQGFLRGSDTNKTGLYWLGEKNSGKSSGMKVLKRIFDYTKSDSEEGIPKNGGDLFIKAQYNQILWFSNCRIRTARKRDETMEEVRRIQTDGAISSRKFFTQDFEHSAKASRTLWFDGNEMIFEDGDQFDRTWIATIPALPANKPRRRKTENEAAFREHGPKIMGCVLRGWQAYLSNQLPSPVGEYRMPEDAAMAAAAESVYGFAPGSTRVWIQKKVDSDNARDLQGRPATIVLRSFRGTQRASFGDKQDWYGRPGKLLKELERHAADMDVRLYFNGGKGLRNWLFDRKTALLKEGIKAEFHREGVENGVAKNHIRLTFIEIPEEKEEERPIMRRGPTLPLRVVREPKKEAEASPGLMNAVSALLKKNQSRVEYAKRSAERPQKPEVDDDTSDEWGIG